MHAHLAWVPMTSGGERASASIYNRISWPPLPTFSPINFLIFFLLARTPLTQPLQSKSQTLAMAPSKRAKIITACKREWKKSILKREYLEEMVIDGVLSDEALASWRPAVGEQFIDPQPGELVVSEGFFYRGFGLPAHPFVYKLMNYYGILHIHLHPNSYLQLSVFINLCEAYLGIEPHFNLFHHLFQLEPNGEAKEVGAVYLTMREGASEEYKTILLNTLLKRWKAKWFYAGNVGVHGEDVELPDDIDAEVKLNANWTARLDSNGMVQVKELVGLLAQINIKRVEVAQNFIGRRTHPCKLRQRLAYEYHLEDFGREAPELVSNIKIDRRISRPFTIKREITWKARERNPPRAFYVMHPPPPTSTHGCFMRIWCSTKCRVGTDEALCLQCVGRFLAYRRGDPRHDPKDEWEELGRAELGKVEPSQAEHWSTHSTERRAPV